MIGVESLGDPNVEYDVLSSFIFFSVFSSSLTSSYSSSFNDDSSSRDNIIGVGADG